MGVSHHMANRSSEAGALAARAKGVGWRVDLMKAGQYKVWMDACPDPYCNHILQIHRTPSDRNWAENVERELNRHGLDRLETRRATKRENDKNARLADARRAAEQRAQELVAQAGTIRKAAGPYAGPEFVELDWFTTKHPAPIMRWVIMTPDLAAQILAASNTDNRPQSTKQIDHYAGVIASDQWRLTHQGGAHDRNGVLQDGQHRLEAIVEAGIAVPMAWFCGMDPDNWKALDEGLARTAGQLLRKAGHSNTATLQAAAKLILAYEDGPAQARRAYHGKRTNQQMVDFIASDPDMIEAAAWAGTAKTKSKTAPGPLAAAYYLLRKKNGKDNPYLDAFWRGYVTERKLDQRFALDVRDPRLAVRRQFANIRERGFRVTGLEGMSLLILAWNYVVDGKTRVAVVFRENSPVPDIMLCHPKTSAVPALLVGEIDTPELVGVA